MQWLRCLLGGAGVVHSTLRSLGKQQQVAQVLGPLPHMWETRVEFQVSGCGHMGSDSAMEELTLSLPVSAALPV